MAFDFNKSLTALQQRKFGDDLKKGEIFENFSGKASESILYITEAMEPVSKTYTENTYKQCDRVISQIKDSVSAKHSSLSFEYQGSVPLNVHIRRHSDIDLLVVTGRYHWVTPPLQVTSPYLGNATDDLLELREDLVKTVTEKFPAVVVDDDGGKATAIEGGSLNRKIDLISCSWVHNTNSYGTSDLTSRGIRLYDRKEEVTIENYPFLHIARCNAKDIRVGGKYKKLVRYIKNIIKDTDDIKISSYDAAGIMYLQGEMELIAVEYTPAALSVSCEKFLLRVLNDPELINNATVPNGTRKLFGTNGLSTKEVLKLYTVLKEINVSIIPLYGNMIFDERVIFERLFRNAS